MAVSSIAASKLTQDCPSVCASPDKLPWSFAGPVILATSLGLWLVIGEGLAAILG